MTALGRTSIAALAFAALLAPQWAPAADPGERAPAFALPNARGDTVSLDALRGRLVYVDFWASWCGPCRRSFPWMNEMHRRHSAQGLAIVAINVDQKRADAERFLKQNPANFEIVYDSAGVAPAAFGVHGMPTSYLIDPTGKVIAVEEGFRDDHREALEERIRALLPSRAI